MPKSQITRRVAPADASAPSTKIMPVVPSKRSRLRDVPVDALRVARGLHQTAVAKGSGVSLRTVQRMMQGGVCSPVTCKRVADFLGGDALELWPDLLEDPRLRQRDLPLMRDAIAAP